MKTAGSRVPMTGTTHRSYVRRQILRDAHRARRDLRDDVDAVLRRANGSGDWPRQIDVSDLDPSICRDVARQVSALGEHEVVEVVDEDGRRVLEIDRIDDDRADEDLSDEASAAIVSIPGAIPTAIVASRSDRRLFFAALVVAGLIGLQMMLLSTVLVRVVALVLELPVLLWGLPILRRIRSEGQGGNAIARGIVLPPAPPARLSPSDHRALVGDGTPQSPLRLIGGAARPPEGP